MKYLIRVSPNENPHYTGEEWKWAIGDHHGNSLTGTSDGLAATREEAIAQAEHAADRRYFKIANEADGSGPYKTTQYLYKAKLVNDEKNKEEA